MDHRSIQSLVLFNQFSLSSSCTRMYHASNNLCDIPLLPSLGSTANEIFHIMESLHILLPFLHLSISNCWPYEFTQDNVSMELLKKWIEYLQIDVFLKRCSIKL